MTCTLPPVIIGTGPAGLACAAALLEAGLRPIVLDESLRPGGQGTRRLSAAMAPHVRTFMGRRAARHTVAREAVEDGVLAACDWRPGSLVWGVFANQLEILREGAHESLRFDQLMIATGATDRILAIPGWELPGVFSLGGAQVALKQHSSFIGRRVVLAGASPLLYLAAAQYLRMGACDVTLVDTAPPAAKWRAALGMALSSPATSLEGLGLLLELARHKVRRIKGARLVRAVGLNRLEAIEIRHRGGNLETIDCDALAFGYGLRPETQLAELAGARFRFDAALRNWFPVIDSDGCAGDGLWLAGDGALTGGRMAAALSGRLAALSMIEKRQNRVATQPSSGREAARLRRKVGRLRQFQAHLAIAFPMPEDAASTLPDDAIVCRCERITAGEVRAAVAAVAGPVEINRVKAVTRCGMGRCQGRFCGPTLQELTAATCGASLADVGRLRAQAPVRPIPVASAVVDGIEG